MTAHLRFEWINWNSGMGPNKIEWPHSDFSETTAHRISQDGIEKWGQTPLPGGRSASRMRTRSVCPESALGARAAAHNAGERTAAGVGAATGVSA
jgi:hypothetical protein